MLIASASAALVRAAAPSRGRGPWSSVAQQRGTTGGARQSSCTHIRELASARAIVRSRRRPPAPVGGDERRTPVGGARGWCPAHLPRGFEAEAAADLGEVTGRPTSWTQARPRRTGSTSRCGPDSRSDLREGTARRFPRRGASGRRSPGLVVGAAIELRQRCRRILSGGDLAPAPVAGSGLTRDEPSGSRRAAGG